MGEGLPFLAHDHRPRKAFAVRTTDTVLRMVCESHTPHFAVMLV